MKIESETSTNQLVGVPNRLRLVNERLPAHKGPFTVTGSGSVLKNYANVGDTHYPHYTHMQTHCWGLGNLLERKYSCKWN